MLKSLHNVVKQCFLLDRNVPSRVVSMNKCSGEDFFGKYLG